MGFLPPTIELSTGEIARLVPHVFLPRKLPGKASASLAEDEGNLLRLLRDVVVEASSWSDNKCLNQVVNLFNTWVNLQQYEEVDPQFLSAAISALEPGDAFALYIRAQNAGFLLTIPDDEAHEPETAILSTFPAMPKLSDVMGTPGDLASVYPSSSIHIPVSDLLKSDTFGWQLSTLCSTACDLAVKQAKQGRSSRSKMQDVPDPLMISRLITAMLTNEESDFCSHFKTISKRIRDQVTRDSKNHLPFRRSGLWMVAKTVLQLTFVNGLDKTDGMFMYKMVVLKVMLFCCQKLKHFSDTDLSMQMLAKLARRVRKLENYHADNKVSRELRTTYLELQREVIQTMERIKSVLDKRWMAVVHEDEKKSTLLPLPKLNFENDTKHLLEASKKHLSPQQRRNPVIRDVIPSPKCPPRYHRVSSISSLFPISHFGTDGEENLGIVLCEFEMYVRRIMETYANTSNSQHIRKLFEKYVQKAQTFYLNDPVGVSRMVITSLKIVQNLDKVAVNNHALLDEHRSGVDADIIKDLLLPQVEDMDLAQELELYFRSRNKAEHKSLIEEQTVSYDSFTARFAKNNRQMIQLREKILADAERAVSAKITEVQQGRSYCESLRTRASNLSHDSITRINRRGCPYTFHPNNRCTKCSLDRQADNYKVNLYERPLPSNVEEQYAVVFELLMPDEIASLRDSLYFFNTEVCSATLSSPYTQQINSFWTNYSEISRYRMGKQEHIKLGTTRTLSTSQRSSRSPEYCTDYEFIVENGFNCHFAAESKLLSHQGKADIKNVCSFSISKDLLYKDLDKWLKHTSHNQNEVLAKQSECPRNMSLAEFKEFGTLRAGHRLQLRNIYRALEQDTLSFHKEPVFSLICQSVWQAGPLTEANPVSRESHDDLADPEFSRALLVILKETLAQQSENWTNYFTMLTVIVLTTRTLSLTTHHFIKVAALELLLKCRIVATSWMEKVEGVLSDTADFPKDKVEELRLNLLNVSLCTSLTFWVDQKYFPQIMNSSSDVECWFKAITRIQDNIILSTAGVESLPLSLRNLLRWVRNLGVGMEDHLVTLLKGDSKGLDNFTKNHWAGSRKGNVGPWESCSGDKKQLYQSVFVSHEGHAVTLHVDIIRGNFLLNGCPVSHLPSAISHHKDYHRVFSNIIFEVQPAAGQSGTYVTALKYHNSDYSFALQQGCLIVTETQENGKEFQLVPHHIFEGDIPLLLINEFSHWWSRADNTVSFRPISFSDKEFQNKVKYILDLTTFTILDLSTNNLLIDINSPSYTQLQTVVGRMEHCDYIHMFWKKDGKAIVELPRMALHFEITQDSDDECQLLSREYPEMKVARKQKFGSFVGLDQGLLLVSTNSSITVNPRLLIPHGVVSVYYEEKHQRIHIDLNTKLREPQYFAFEVDMHLHELRAGQSQSGWVYLALLHATTASPLPDPFTSLTGTEAALRLMQSPRCWSCQPLDKEVATTLAAIGEISPCRKYYPTDENYAEHVKWPQGVGALAAHDGYQMLVEVLVQESQRLSFLHESYENDNKEEDDDDDDDEEAIGTENSVFSNKLVEKSYWRNIHFYTEQADIRFEHDVHFLKVIPPTISASSFETDLDGENMKNVRMLAHLGHVWSCELPKPKSSGYLAPLLIEQGGNLTGLTDLAFCPVDVLMILRLDVRQSWLDLYNFARKVKDYGVECEWALLLSTMAFTGVSLEQLQLLHSVAVHPATFQSRNPPPYLHYVDCNQNEFNLKTISSLIGQSAISFEEYESRTGKARKYGEESWDYQLRRRETKELYDSLVRDQTQQLTELARSQWPTKQCKVATTSNFNEIRLESALLFVNSVLNKWYMNLELKNFLQETEKAMFQLESSADVVLNYELTKTTSFPEKCLQERISEVCLVELVRSCDNVAPENEAEHIFTTGYSSCGADPSTSNCMPVRTNFPWAIDESCKIGSTYMTTTKESWDAYHQKSRKRVTVDPNSTVLVDQLQKKSAFYSEKARAMRMKIENMIHHASDNFTNKALIAAGIFPRITPATILPLICDEQLDQNVRNLIGATAVLWTLEQRANRCLKYIMADGGPMEVALKKELVCRGHDNWSPRERPEWLLLELEMDLMIRPIQVDVAKAMLHPGNNRNAVMQLNMGEGKTTVIIPMVAATLGNGKQLCRVTVLKSLFHTNLNALAFKLGGLLSRRVYSIPCRRDMAIGKTEAEAMLQTYKECAVRRGVVMTLPEYRLSFELKGYENCRSRNYDDATALLEVQHWLKQNARDVLDESDEILHVKYQLVYTVGDQRLVDGGRLRWTVAQRLLKLIPSRLEEIMTNFVNAAECSKNLEHPECFPHCRLLKFDCYKKLCAMLVADVLRGALRMEFPHLTSQEKNTIAYFLTNAEISEVQHEEVIQMFDKFSDSYRDMLLTLRGLLACGVLSLVLNKRWRVNFGVNHNGSRLMAVPFRAKDVAAERTEFGHPDVAILSTILSYYYSGLSHSQLDQCFDILYLQNNCDEEYEQWISEITSIDPSIKKLSGINLADYEQRTRCVYPALLKNMAVIDFWLDRVVFPKEAKQFGWKMTCSAWDLCSDEAVHPVTGFSGTNDSKLLLPLNISQRDLPELLGTSGEVLHNLLLPENNNYKYLPPGRSNEYILHQLVKNGIHLLLDVGALMTDLDNQSLARKWLELTSLDVKDAVIYFDADDKLVVTDRQRRTNLLEQSPFRGRMDRCIIYLDDFHTRGTDLKIPRGTKGCVTLGKGITKDKLVQGCMRMRMLGEGHTVCFWASKEVDDEIVELCGIATNFQDVETQHVLTWAMENSRLATRDGYLHWTAGGFNYLQKKAAHTLFDQSCKNERTVFKLGERCSDSDVIYLMDMYGTVRRDALFWEIANVKFKNLLSLFSKSNLLPDELSIYSNMMNTVSLFGSRIVHQCEVFVPEYKRMTSLLDEEQERELEHELEEEHEVQRPRAASPASPTLDIGVEKFVKEGIVPTGDKDNWCVKLPMALQTTALWPEHIQQDCWGQNIFATKDFVNVVTISSVYSVFYGITGLNTRHHTRIPINNTDEFLRPLTWIATLTQPSKTILLLLSPFEVNLLMPVFRSKKAAAVLHMYAARLHLGQDNLFQHPLLMVPQHMSLGSQSEYGFINANLSLFSGNLYFANKAEQDAYVEFLGLIPYPHTGEEQRAIDEGWTCNGFVKAEYRERLPHITSPFLSNPVDLVRGIIDRRCEYFPSMSHVASIILQSKKPL